MDMFLRGFWTVNCSNGSTIKYLQWNDCSYVFLRLFLFVIVVIKATITLWMERWVDKIYDNSLCLSRQRSTKKVWVLLIELQWAANFSGALEYKTYLCTIMKLHICQNMTQNEFFRLKVVQVNILMSFILLCLVWKWLNVLWSRSLNKQRQKL